MLADGTLVVIVGRGRGADARSGRIKSRERHEVNTTPYRKLVLKWTMWICGGPQLTNLVIYRNAFSEFVDLSGKL